MPSIEPLFGEGWVWPGGSLIYIPIRPPLMSTLKLPAQYVGLRLNLNNMTSPLIIMR